MDAKEFIKTKGITELPEQFIVSKGGYPINLTELAKLLTEFSQQPTEKTREGAIYTVECIYELFHSPRSEEYNGDVSTKIIDALIQSGYIQSDSVDAEQAFEKYYEKYKKEHPNTASFIPISIHKAAFLAGSKVKPVNENLRKVLEETLPFVANYENIRKKVESALSTAPDDGWISCTELPPIDEKVKNGVRSIKVLYTNGEDYYIAYYDYEFRKWYKILETRHIGFGYNPSDYEESKYQPLPKSPR